MQWSARCGFGAALDCQRCPSVARTPHASGSSHFGVASSLTKEIHFVFFASWFHRRFDVWITVLGKTDFSVLLCSLRLGF
ncbi:hypothetical protein RHMOL_Rhmol13G0096200 [Rhododendron molle]|uniref:Uncharacterized protein n=1 Tax=Rhododendron molle TaxID=49168 RepID=A0ACC0L5T5_RHOML|nr:hypothetical protein RHMOL_Rhmol13G0096200 [Rhododendron molle]